MWCTLLLSVAARVGAVTAGANLTDIQAAIPACSVDCFSAALSANPELVSLPDKSCGNVTLQAPLSKCLQLACSFEEQAQYMRATSGICEGQPIESRGPGAMVEAVVLGPITLLTVATRIYSRKRVSKELGTDDYLILAASSLYGGMIAMFVVNTILGFGRHFWNIDPMKIRILLLIFYIGEISYLTCLPLIKLSILFFYLRIFITERFRVKVWITIGFVASSSVAFIIAALLQCVPISGAFDRSIPAKCLDFNAVAFSNGAIGILQDLIILVLPFPEVIHLTMITRKKIILIVMFLLGSFAVLTSIIRMNYLHKFATSTDQTWDNQEGSMWSLAEQGVAMICACLPAIRKLLSDYLPDIFDIDGSMSSSETPSYVYPLSTPFSKRRSRRCSVLTGDEIIVPNDRQLETADTAHGIGTSRGGSTASLCEHVK